MGPNAGIHYSASVDRETWHEEGWFLHDNHRVAKVFEMTLQRLASSKWPDDALVPAK